MRIICISASTIPSDTANSIQVMKVCQAFTQIGHEVLLLVLGEQKKDFNQKALFEHYGLTTPFKIRWLPGKNRHYFPWRAVWEARRKKPDALYVWPLQSAALGLLAGLPTLVEIHDYPSGRFGWFWLTFFKILPGHKRFLPITNALKLALHLPTTQTMVAPDGVDLERYASLPSPANARRKLKLPELPTVLCTGHLYEGRGVQLFINLAKKFPKINFIWVGGRPMEVQSWSQRAKGNTNVLFTGFVPNALIPLWQAAADVLLMPYQQSVATSSGGNTAEICSPMKMFEYMAAGRPILTSDLPVLREILDERTAIFCPPNDQFAWESHLKKLFFDNPLRKSLGENACRAVKKYSWINRQTRILEEFV